MKEILELLLDGKDLSDKQMEEAMESIMTGKVDDIIISSFLTALRSKGETIDEITAGAKILRKLATNVEIDEPIMLDIVGTGGDKYNTFNISTASSIVVAATKTCVLKHGNRSVSSKCGAADVLEELGVKLELSPKEVANSVKKTYIGFLYAPAFHNAMRFVGPTRKKLGVRTMFNILGPLINPANANYQLAGVYDEELLMKYAKVLKNLGLKKALVIHGNDGMDEITLTTKTKVVEMENGEFKEYEIDPREYGMKFCKGEELVGGDKSVNAQIIKDIFNGEKGPKADIVLLNAGTALYTAGTTKSIGEGIDLARATVKSGAAKKKLEEFIAVSHELA